MREEVKANIDQHKVIAIIRDASEADCLQTAQALYNGGIRLMEVAFSQRHPETFKETAAVIQKLTEAFGGKVMIGAGTVTSTQLVDLAREAGAQYIISPDMNVQVIEYTRKHNLVSLPGAMTPSEILRAHNAGADYVKVFPAGVMGSEYIKAIRAPLNHVKMLAVGGVSENNASELLNTGIAGLGIGGNLVNRKWIEAGMFTRLTKAAENLMKAVDDVK